MRGAAATKQSKLLKTAAILFCVGFLFLGSAVKVQAGVVSSDSDLINWRYDPYPITEVLSGIDQTWGNVVYDHVNSIWRSFYGSGILISDANIYQKTGTNGRDFGNKTLVLSLGVSGSWDNSRLFDPYAWYEAGQDRPWRMIYAATGSSGNYGIGLATSVDGVTWTREDANGNSLVNSITNIANNGSGLIRVTVPSHPWHTSDQIFIGGVVGTTEANGSWTITYIDQNTFDLQGSTFTHTYTSGGIASQPVLIPGTGLAWDNAQIDHTSLIKVGSTYYFYYCTVSGSRETGLATSTDLVHWTKDANNPLFTGVTDYSDKNHSGTVDSTAGFFSADVVYWPRTGDSNRYVMFIGHYVTGNVNAGYDVYVSDNPEFTQANRTYIGQAFNTVNGTNYLQGYQIYNSDTPKIITDDITRNVATSTDTGNNILMVSSVKIIVPGLSNRWTEVMLVYNKSLNGAILSNVGADLPVTSPTFQLAPTGDANTAALWLPGLTGTLQDLTGNNYNLQGPYNKIDSNGLNLVATNSQKVWWGDLFSTFTPVNAITGDFTLEARVSFASSFTSGSRGIIGYGASGGTNHHHFNLYVTGAAGPSYSVTFTTASGGLTKSATAALGAITLDQMYRITVTRTNGLIYFFKDGVLLNTGGSAFNWTIDSSPTSTFFLGSDDTGSTLYWNGYIDEIRVSNIARWTSSYTPAALIYNYNTSGTIFTPVYDFGPSNNQSATITPVMTTPTNTSVTLKVRSASSNTDQSSTIGDFSSLPQSGITSEYQQFALVLNTTNTSATPTINSVDVENISNIATVTSSTYTVSALSGGVGAITNVSSGTSQADFLAALTLATGATWNTTSVANPVVSGNTLVVTAQDGTTTGTYTITVNAADITTAGVTGFTAPATGGTPQVFGALTAGSAQYTVTGLTWSPTDNPFLASTAYTATVVLTSATTYKFPTGGIAVPTADGGGTVSAGTTSGGDVSGNALTFTVLFPATVNSPDATIPTSHHSGGGSAQNQVNNLISMGNYTLARQVANQYGLTLPTNTPTPTVSITSTTNSTSSFTRDLKYGMTNSEIKLLQIYLNTHGYIVSITGAGSLNHETTYFGPATRAAVIKFQKANNITPAVGYFGPITRGYIK